MRLGDALDPAKRSETVLVYVRKGTVPDSRLLSFHRPRTVRIPDQHVLARGFAFDGNSIVAEVTRRTVMRSVVSNEGTGEPPKLFEWLSEGEDDRPLSKALIDAELLVKNWFEEMELLVEFA